MPLDSSRSVITPQQIQQLRKSYEQHLAAGGMPEEFAPEPMRPAQGLDFALIGTTPKRETKSRYYRCAFCHEDLKFSTGKVVLSADTKVRLIGPDCWKDHFDTEEYQARAKDLSDYELTQRFADVRPRLQREISQAIPRVRTLAQGAGDVLHTIATLPTRIRDDRSGFGSLLRGARPSAGWLTVENTVPDEKHGRDKHGRPNRFRIERTRIHQIAGLEAVFSTSTSLRHDAEFVLAELFKAKETIEVIPQTGDHAGAAKAIRSVLLRLGRVNSTLSTIGAAVQSAQQFLDLRNLRGIATWASNDNCAHSLAGKIKLIGRELVVEGNSDALTISAPNSLEGFLVPDLDEVTRLIKLT